LTFVLTDGEENRSKNPKSKMSQYLRNAAENWSVGFLVPNQSGVREMERLGALADSIAIWDTSSAAGLIEAGKQMTSATENFFTFRDAGVRGSRGVFSTSLANVNKRSVRVNLTPLKNGAYKIYPATSAASAQIRDFVTREEGHYSNGNAFYRLRKKETIQPSKDVIVVEKATGKAYGGDDARHLIGLPDGEYVDVRPDSNPSYDVFIQSTSVNRKVERGDEILVLQ
jgi:hypothetical protein